ncbi:endonuclease/exonuclease/phosphatase family protein [Agromyces intestinalis]|uniref:Endonuclease/exonuclease/phosphatase family protein n=1 Tax=Agromyces intestinalis TaxID=2592652 RepID=A0A5C1YL75_9MICO|nr:endonuclease/exonuclease/phosphatase family protein [Agromyces intestinalis]QEO15562.1 endonuclease/exonuclease/phosphatase family protein [Agromyces intestinalis]
MLSRVVGLVVVALAALAAAILVWPQAVGLNDQWVAAHIVALRGSAAAVAVVGAVVLALVALIRPLRRVAVALTVVAALFAVANVGILAVRGFGSGGTTTDASQPASGEASDPEASDPEASDPEASDPEASDEASDEASGPIDHVTVLAWNTLGEVPEASTIAELALREEADVIVLPETTDPLGEEIAVAMRDGGRPMWVHTSAYSEELKAQSTTLLISPELGGYEVTTPDWPGPPDNTNTVPTVVAEPVDGQGPRIVAAHAVAPIRWELRNWRSDLDWLAEQCAGDDVIMAGDFNATLDHFAGRGVDGGDLGRCHDAALQAGAAGLGTWPTNLPQVLGSPIDHVLATPTWRTVRFEVLGEFDDSGSDHRPVVAELVRAH